MFAYSSEDGETSVAWPAADAMPNISTLAWSLKGSRACGQELQQLQQKMLATAGVAGVDVVVGADAGGVRSGAAGVGAVAARGTLAAAAPKTWRFYAVLDFEAEAIGTHSPVSQVYFVFVFCFCISPARPLGDRDSNRRHALCVRTCRERTQRMLRAQCSCYVE